VYELLLAGVMFPHKCSDNMINRRSYDSFWDYKDKTGNLKLRIWYIHQRILKWLFCFSFGSVNETMMTNIYLKTVLVRHWFWFRPAYWPSINTAFKVWTKIRMSSHPTSWTGCGFI
jgi:hypothetical protein